MNKTNPYSRTTTGLADLVQDNHYFPYGMMMSDISTSSTDNRFRYNGKEYQNDLGLEWYDYGARMYDPALARWHSVDPMAEKSRRWSIYNYCMDNPLRYIDKDGRSAEVYLLGDDAQAAFRQLQSSTNLTLSKAKNGKVTATGEAKTKNDQLLLEATKSKEVIVKIGASNQNVRYFNSIIIGGAFLGNTIETKTEETTFDLGFIDAVGEVSLKLYTNSSVATTYQLVNPEVLGNLDVANRKTGDAILHETLESYIGGLLSLSRGVSSTISGKGSVYDEAHEQAPYQGGIVTEKYWDANGQPIQNVKGAMKAEYYSNGQLIMRWPK